MTQEVVGNKSESNRCRCLHIQTTNNDEKYEIMFEKNNYKFDKGLTVEL